MPAKKSPKKSSLHCAFTCKLCGTDIDLPACCEEGTIEIRDGKVFCRMCGSQKTVPVCCGQEVMLAGGSA